MPIAAPNRGTHKPGDEARRSPYALCPCHPDQLQLFPFCCPLIYLRCARIAMGRWDSSCPTCDAISMRACGRRAESEAAYPAGFSCGKKLFAGAGP